MKIHVGPLILPVSLDRNDFRGNIRLRIYQSQLLHCNDKRILLEAPTSSGKTLAYLLRALESTERGPRYRTTIIVYPTNALAWDQALSLHTLMTRIMGKRVNLTVESNEDTRWRTEDPNAEVDLYVLNGETLAALSQESRTPEGKSIIEQFRKNQAEARIILTNPEILYYMFLYKFAKAENLIDVIFQEKTPNLLVFDEFHLYHGYSLATITYMLAYLKELFDQIIFSSATPISIESIIHEPYQRIFANPSTEGDVVRHPTELDIESTGTILSSDDIPNIKRLVDQYYNACKDRTQNVKVLVILNSIMTCVGLQKNLEKYYPGEVTSIHGLVPSGSRPRDKFEFKSIVVGTSAIEVGIDFDVSSLIIEAHDYSTFVQRLGRGARHDSCSVFAFLPELYMPSLREKLSKDSYISPQALNAHVRECLPDLPSYASFPLSKYAAPIFLAVLINWVNQRPAGKKPNDGEIINQTMRLLEDGKFYIPYALKSLEDHLLRLCQESPSGEVLTMARKMSCRSSLDSIPAVFIENGKFKFDRLSLSDLQKVHFRLVDRKSLTERRVKIPWNMRLENEFLEVNEVRQRESKAKIVIQNGKFDERPAPLVGFQVLADDHKIKEMLALVLKKQPAYLLIGKDDWRLPGLFVSGGGYLVVGGDAYLAWYIRNNIEHDGKRSSTMS